MLAENDSLVDSDMVAKTADRMPSGELVRYPVRHFDLYTGNLFQAVVKKQTDFLIKQLGVVAPSSSTNR